MTNVWCVCQVTFFSVQLDNFYFLTPHVTNLIGLSLIETCFCSRLYGILYVVNSVLRPLCICVCISSSYVMPAELSFSLLLFTGIDFHEILLVYWISCWPYAECLRSTMICMTPWYCYPTLSHQHYSYRRNLISCRNADNILGCFAVMLDNFDLFKENIQQSAHCTSNRSVY